MSRCCNHTCTRKRRTTLAVLTSSLTPAVITSLPSRLHALYLCDKTSVVTTSSTAAVKRLNRVQSADFTMDTPLIEVEEMGAQFRVGMVDELGETKWKLNWADVGVRNLCTLTGTKFDDTTPGNSITLGLTNFQNALVDIIRLVADPQNNVFGSLYMQDGVIDDYTVDAKETALTQESVSGRSPNAVFFPGYFLPKTYLCTSTDVTNGYLNINNILGADEDTVKIYLPTAVATPGTVTPTGSGSGGSLAAGTYAYRVAARNAVGTTLAGAETTPYVASGSTSSVALAWSAVTGATGGYDVYGRTPSGEVFLKHVSSNSYTDTGADTPDATKPLPTLNTTAVPSYWQENGAQYFLKIEKVPLASLTATPVRYYEANSPNGKTATYNNSTKRLTPSDAFVAGDVFRLVIVSYNSDGLPTSIPASTPDIKNLTDRAGITARTVPVTISASKISRVQSASIKFALKRDHVQGLGEKTIVYGVPAVPNTDVSFDLKETDITLLSLLSTGSANLSSQGGTIANDFQDLNYITRIQLATNVPFVITMNDPFNVSAALGTYTISDLAIKSIGYADSPKSDSTIKCSAVGQSGAISISYTVPA